MLWKRILMVVDTPDGFGPEVLGKVSKLTAGLDAEVEVFDTVFDPTLADCTKAQNAIERRRLELELTVAALQAQSVRAHATVRWAYPPRDGIAQRLAAYEPDLVIIRSNKHSRLARMLFTYSDYKLIETAPCPILIIKNDRPYGDAGVVAAVDPMHAHDKPAALDEKILDLGASVARVLGEPLHIFHARSLLPPELPTSRGTLRDLPATVYEDICGAWQAKADARVRLLAQAAQVPEQRVHIGTGDPASLLPEFVAENSTDLLVMGAVSRSWIGKALIGYTAERVLDRAECDLLIVRQPG